MARCSLGGGSQPWGGRGSGGQRMLVEPPSPLHPSLFLSPLASRWLPAAHSLAGWFVQSLLSSWLQEGEGVVLSFT
jgi:hypothetical protein